MRSRASARGAARAAAVGLGLAVAGCTSVSSSTLANLFKTSHRLDGQWVVQESQATDSQNGYLPTYWDIGDDGAGNVAGRAWGPNCQKGLVVGTLKGNSFDVAVQLGPAASSPSELVGTVSAQAKTIAGTQPDVWIAARDDGSNAPNCPDGTPAPSSGITGGVFSACPQGPICGGIATPTPTPCCPMPAPTRP